MFADEEGKGYLIRLRKQRNQKSPNLTGEAIILGHRVKLIGWAETSRTGRPLINIRLEDRGVAPFNPENQLTLGA
jgi:hypothetical protein